MVFLQSNIQTILCIMFILLVVSYSSSDTAVSSYWLPFGIKSRPTFYEKFKSKGTLFFQVHQQNMQIGLSDKKWCG